MSTITKEPPYCNKIFQYQPFGGIQILPSRYIGVLVTPEMPAKKLAKLKRYKERTMKRWRRDHPPYYQADGQYFLDCGESVILCHPDDVPKLLRALNHAGKDLGVS